MTSAERNYEYSTVFIASGVYDTLEAMGGEDIASPVRNEVVECRLSVYGKTNHYRFTLHPLPFGCLLRIDSVNPDGSLSVETEERMLNAIFNTLEQLIEDAVAKNAFTEG